VQSILHNIYSESTLSIQVKKCTHNYFIDDSFSNEPADGASGYSPQIAQLRAHGHEAPSFSSSEEDPLDEEEAHQQCIQVDNHLQMRRQLLQQARTLRIAQEQEDEQAEGKNTFGCSSGVAQKQTSFKKKLSLDSPASGLGEEMQPQQMHNPSSTDGDLSSDANDPLTADEVLVKMSPEFMAIVVQYDMSHTAAAAMWNFALENG
jgi:hypothetical protein